MGRQIGYLFGWPVIVGQVFGVESPETPTEEKGVGGCDGPQEPVNTSGAPSGGEQAPNPGSGAATECVLCGHNIEAHDDLRISVEYEHLEGDDRYGLCNSCEGCPGYQSR